MWSALQPGSKTRPAASPPRPFVRRWCFLQRVERFQSSERRRPDSVKFGRIPRGGFSISFSREGLYPFALYWAQEIGIFLPPYATLTAPSCVTYKPVAALTEAKQWRFRVGIAIGEPLPLDGQPVAALGR
jgi:hypothetical protein